MYKLEPTTQFKKDFKSIPEDKHAEIENVFNIIQIFYGCLSLCSLPDLSKGNKKRFRIEDYKFNCLNSLK